jgi:PAS domain S-box-containing protein
MTESDLPAEPPGGLDAHFREVIDSTPAMIWAAGREGGRLWFNRPLLAFTGDTTAGALRGDWAARLHPDDVGRSSEIYARHFDAKTQSRMQYRLRYSDGTYRWIEETAIPRFARDGGFLGYIGTCADIHDHKAAEIELRTFNATLESRLAELAARLGSTTANGAQELLHRSAQFDVLVQGITDYAVYMMDPDGLVITWNSGAERTKGYAADEIIGRHFSSFFTEADRQANLPTRILRQCATDGRFEAESWRVRKDGSRFWASTLINAIRDKSGKLTGFAKVTRDVTEKHRAQDLLDQARDRLLQMQKMEAIGQLTGGVAHDFNNLLMVIIGNLEIAESNAEPKNGSTSRLRHAIGNAMRGARRAATLTQRLLAFSRRQALAPRPVGLNRFIAGDVEFLQRALGESVAVEAVGGAGLWLVEIDPDELESALLNLALNARDAMPDGGKLTIETSNAFLDEEYCRANPEVLRGQYVLISVTDNGAGMTEEIVNRAFEPFFSTKAAGQGTGLGLSQVYGFIKQSGGHVKIYSEPGEGTTIKIYLPRTNAEASTEHEDRTKAPVQGQRGETILVVEDDDDVRSYLMEILDDLNYNGLRARDSVSALRILEQADIHVDLLLTDVVLPGANGRELAHHARALRPGLKILFMTGYSRNAIVHQGRLDPGVELMQKPITRGQLALRLRSLLDAAPDTRTI